MPDAPFITGSDIVSNAGNAALGYSSGVAYNANPAVENPYATTQSAVARLAQEEEYKMQIMFLHNTRQRMHYLVHTPIIL